MALRVNKYMNKKILILFGFCLWLTLPVWSAGEAGSVGISIIKENFNPIKYDSRGFVVNDIGAINVRRLNGEDEISGYLNQMNAGKRLLNLLLDYPAEMTRSSVLTDRMPAEHRASATAADTVAAVLNNYILVVKLDDASRLIALQGDTVGRKLQGSWYLYRYDFDFSNLDELRRCIICPGDNAMQRGEKRALYDRLSLVLRLEDMGEGVSAERIRKVMGRIKYIDSKSASQMASKRHKKPGFAVKVALSPLLIVK